MAEEFKGINQETLKNVELLKGSMKEIAESTRNLNKQFKDYSLLLQDSSSNYTSIVSSASKFAELQTKVSKSASTTSKAFGEQQKQLSNIRSLNSQIENLMDQMVNSTKEEERLILKQAQNLASARDNAKELANAYGELAENSADLDKSTIWFSSIAEVAKDIPGLRKISGPFEAASKAARETVISNAKIKSINENISSLGEEALKTGKGLTKEKLKELGLSEQVGNLTGSSAASTLKSYQANNKTASVGIAGMQAGFKALGPMISKALGPLALIGVAVEAIKFFVDAMFEADKRVVSLSRNLQISRNEAENIDTYFKAIKGSLETQFNLTKDIYQAQAELSELSAASVLFSKETLDAQIQLTKEYGLQAQDAANLNKIFITNDETATDALDTAAKTTSEFFKQNKVLLNERKLLEQASKVSGQLLVSFKGSTKELINAVAKANLLGISLEKARDISMSTLNFEESISSELEAELLTGKNLNFERARGLALQGKFAEAAEETIKQVGTLEDFQRLNVIQQEALAKAAGITVDQLSDALIQQKLIDKDAKAQFARLKEAGNEELARRFALGQYSDKEIEDANKRLDAQQKFSMSLDRVKEVFTDLVTGGALDTLANTISALSETIQSGGSIFSLFGKSDLSRSIEKKSLEQAQNTISELSEKQKTNTLSELEKEKLQRAQILLEENESKSTQNAYNRTMGIGPKFAEGGIVTKPITNATVGEAGPEAIIPLDQLMKRFDQMNNTLNAILNKESGVYLDGTKVGTAMAVSTYRVQ